MTAWLWARLRSLAHRLRVWRCARRGHAGMEPVEVYECKPAAHVVEVAAGVKIMEQCYFATGKFRCNHCGATLVCAVSFPE